MLIQLIGLISVHSLLSLAVPIYSVNQA